MDNGVPRFTSDGTFSGYIGSCLDITDRKRTEEDLRKADRRKEEFLAVLSHELRNPLAPIQTALDLLEQAGTSGAGAERELAVIERQVQNLRRLVDDLLDVSRISRGRIELRKEAGGVWRRSSPMRSRPSARSSTSIVMNSTSRSPRAQSSWRPTRPGWSRSSRTC